MDYDLCDFAQSEEQLRNILFGSDEWVNPQHGPSKHITAALWEIEDMSPAAKLDQPYAESTERELRCTLVKWIDRRIETE